MTEMDSLMFTERLKCVPQNDSRTVGSVDSGANGTRTNESFTADSPTAISERTEAQRPERFQCQTCSKSFIRAYSLQRHEWIHKEKKPYVCLLCQLSFSERNILREHSRVVHQGKSLDCKVCGRTFSLSFNLKEHEKIHSPGSEGILYKCLLCSESFLIRHQLRYHMNRFHNQNMSLDNTYIELPLENNKKQTLREKQQTSESASLCICDLCGKLFAKKQNLERHMLTHLGNKLLKCEICDTKFDQMARLLRHKESKHKRRECNICKRAFFTKKDFMAHMENHCKVKTFICTVCYRKYKSQNELHQHLLREHRDKRFCLKTDSEEKAFIPELVPMSKESGVTEAVMQGGSYVSGDLLVDRNISEGGHEKSSDDTVMGEIQNFGCSTEMQDPEIEVRTKTRGKMLEMLKERLRVYSDMPLRCNENRQQENYQTENVNISNTPDNRQQEENQRANVNISNKPDNQSQDKHQRETGSISNKPDNRQQEEHQRENVKICNIPDNRQQNKHLREEVNICNIPGKRQQEEHQRETVNVLDIQDNRQHNEYERENMNLSNIDTDSSEVEQTSMVSWCRMSGDFAAQSVADTVQKYQTEITAEAETNGIARTSPDSRKLPGVLQVVQSENRDDTREIETGELRNVDISRAPKSIKKSNEVQAVTKENAVEEAHADSETTGIRTVKITSYKFEAVRNDTSFSVLKGFREKKKDEPEMQSLSESTPLIIEPSCEIPFDINPCELVDDYTLELTVNARASSVIIETKLDRKEGLSCAACGKDVKSREALTNHINLVHTGYKPFQCDICLKYFAVKKNLKKHRKIHLNGQN